MLSSIGVVPPPPSTALWPYGRWLRSWRSCSKSWRWSRGAASAGCRRAAASSAEAAQLRGRGGPVPPLLAYGWGLRAPAAYPCARVRASERACVSMKGTEVHDDAVKTVNNHAVT